MSAVAEAKVGDFRSDDFQSADFKSTMSRHSDPRGCQLPTCPVCADSMVAAEASAFVADNIISYLWTCDTCGYGFVTKHALRRYARC